MLVNYYILATKMICKVYNVKTRIYSIHNPREADGLWVMPKTSSFDKHVVIPGNTATYC